MQIKSMKPTRLSHLWLWGSVLTWLEVAGLREDREGCLQLCSHCLGLSRGEDS